MKYLLLLLHVLLPLQLATANSLYSYKYVWHDFTDFNKTSTTDGFLMSNASLDANGHIVLNKETVSFNFDGTVVRPSLAKDKPFCLGFTVEAGSFSTSGESLINLFSGKFYENESSSLGMDISYNGNQLGEVSFNREPTAQITNRIDPTKDLTVFIDHSSDDVLTVSFYSGNKAVTSMQFEAFKINGGDLTEFVMGDLDSSMVIKGLGIMVGDSISESWIQDYFRTVGVAVPEPGSAAFALFGISTLLLRRRRTA